MTNSYSARPSLPMLATAIVVGSGRKVASARLGSVSREPIGQQTPKFVLREVAEKSRRNAESSERARGVEWPGAVAGCRRRSGPCQSALHRIRQSRHALPDPRVMSRDGI